MTPKHRQIVLLTGVVVVAGVLAAWWILTAGRAANEGFDLTDEGYYLLSYRWWDSNPLALTGVQYLYGPVFEWLGYDIVRLRFVRLLTVVVVHLLFGFSFMRWLRRRRPGAPPTKLWELAGMAVILAAGGMCYSWLPLSPGYNDVVLLGALTLVSTPAMRNSQSGRGPWPHSAALAVPHCRRGDRRDGAGEMDVDRGDRPDRGCSGGRAGRSGLAFRCPRRSFHPGRTRARSARGATLRGPAERRGPGDLDRQQVHRRDVVLADRAAAVLLVE